MKLTIAILFSIFFATCAIDTNAQPGSSLITGVITEKTNAELTILKTVNNKTEVLAGYKVFSETPEFAFAIPIEKNTSYKLVINVMKQGHMRLEVDKRFTFPLQLMAGENLSVKITPSILDEIKKKGIEVKNSTQYPAVSFVSGDLINTTFGGPINLQKVSDGELITVASYTTSKTNKRFQLAIPIKEESFYYVSSLRFRCRVYLKPADELELSINAFTGEYDLINGSEENRLMEKWQKLSLPITDYGYNRSIFQNDSLDLVKYISAYEKLQPVIADFKISNKLSNEHFNHLFDLAIDVDNEYAPMYLWSCLSSRRNNKISSSQISLSETFCSQFMKPKKFNDAKILEIGEGMNYITLYQKLSFQFIEVMEEAGKKKLWREDKMGIMMDVIANDTVKAYFLKEQMETNEVNNLSEFKSIYQPYEKYTFPPSVKKKYNQVYEGFAGDTAYIGKSSYNFSLSDTTGKTVSMKDFKGKVIFIDVWATWCGPCREQFPFLKEIEEEYKKNNDIVFMGISIDQLKDQEKWLKTIRKEKLAGVQLWDNSKTFRQKYGISSVPRFLLIDKQGKWIEIRCPRPEAKEELKRYLDRALQEGSLTTNN